MALRAEDGLGGGHEEAGERSIRAPARVGVDRVDVALHLGPALSLINRSCRGGPELTEAIAVAGEIGREEEDAIDCHQRVGEERERMAFVERWRGVARQPPERVDVLATVGEVGEHGQPESLFAVDGPDDRGHRADEIAEAWVVEECGVAGAEPGEDIGHDRQGLAVDRQAHERGDENRFRSRLSAEVPEADGVGDSLGRPALEGPSPRREGKDPGLGAHRLHLRKQHLDARARPVAREAAARHVGGAADGVDEGRMAAEEIADGGVCDVELRIVERAIGRREVGGGGDRGAGLQVEAGGVLGVDRRRR